MFFAKSYSSTNTNIPEDMLLHFIDLQGHETHKSCKNSYTLTP